MEEMEARIRHIEQKVDKHTNVLDQHHDVLMDIRDAIKDIQGSLHTLTQIQVEQGNNRKHIDELKTQVTELQNRYYQEVPNVVQWKEKTEVLSYRVVAALIIAGIIAVAGLFFAL